MLLSQRKQEIMELLKEKRSISVQALIELLPVSPATIRRDIVSLEKDGLIRRTRGEIHLSGVEHETIFPYATRSIYHQEEKSRIGRLAARFVDEHTSIILDSSSTVFFLAQELLDRHLTVVTNSIDISAALTASHAQVISCGGLLQHEHRCFLGPDAQAFLSKIEVDAAFLGASGVRLGNGLTSSSPFQRDIKQAMIASAKKRYALFDSSKFTASKLYVFADFNEFDALITNTPLPGSKEESIMEQLIRSGVNIIHG